MTHIFQFLDPLGLGAMAQVSRKWRDLVYRNEAWLGFEFRMYVGAMDLFVESREIPVDARHIGEPTQYCFLSWLSSEQKLLKRIAQETDPKAYVNAAYTYWKSLKKPCIHVVHYTPQHVMIARDHITSLEPRDQKRILYRSLAPLDTKTHPAYITWLQAQRSHLRCNGGRLTKPADLTTAEQSDPFCVLAHNTRLLRYERQKHMYELYTRYAERLERSIQALLRHGRTYFDRLDADDAAWDAVAFQLGPGPEGSSAAGGGIAH